jgi:hypothetical protein
VNVTNTYLNFKNAGGGNDWCYLRQIGASEAYKLALDFHDDDIDARFCIRSIQSAGGTDIVKEVFTVDMGNVSCMSSLNVSGFTTLSNDTTINGILNVSGNSNFNNDITCTSSLNVSGITTLSNNTSIFGILNVSGSSFFNNIVTLRSSLNVSGITTLSNNTTINGILNVSGNSIFNNIVTLRSSLNISGFATLSNNTSIFGTLNVSGFTKLHNNTTLLSSLNVSGFTTLNNGVTLLSTLNVSGNTNISNNLIINGTASYAYLGVGSNYDSSFISMTENSDMYISTPDNSMSLSKMYIKSNKVINLNSGAFNWDTMTSTTNVKIDDITGIFLQTPITINLQSNIINLTANSVNIYGFTKLNNNTTLVSSLNVSGLTTLSNNTTINGILNVSGNSNFNNIVTLASSLNVSGLTVLSNNTTINGHSNFNNNVTLKSSLNVSGVSTLSNNTIINGVLNVNGSSNLNDVTLKSSLNVSGLTTLSNNTTLISSLNVSGFTTLNNSVTSLSSFNISGRTIIGSDIYNHSDSLFEVHKNISIRNDITKGSRIDIQVGLGSARSYLSLEQDYDINLYAPSGGPRNTTIALSSDQIRLDAPKTYTNNLVVTGNITSANGLNIGTKTPFYFITNRNVVINGITFSAYDIDITPYIKQITLDNYEIRQFRFRSWLADADFQMYNIQQTRYDIFMSNKNGLSVYAMAMPFDNPYLDETKWADQFLFRRDFNSLTYCSRLGVKKVYCIIEDLL